MSDTEAKPMETDNKEENEKEEKTEEKKKDKKPRAPRKPKAEPAPSTREDMPKRDRKSVQRLTYAAGENIPPLDVKPGSGTALGEIENVEKRLSFMKPTLPILKTLHRVLYPGEKFSNDNVKDNIRKFSGFPSELSKDDKKAVEERLTELTNAQLKDIKDILDVHKGGSKSEVVESILEFLEKPESSGKPYKKKSKSSSSKGKTVKRTASGKKKTGSTRGRSAYLIFSIEQRPVVKEENPDVGFGELNKMIGAKWNALSDKEKAVYTAKSKAEAGESSSSSKKKSKKSKKASDDEEEEEEQEEEEEEGDKEEEEEKEQPKKKKAKTASSDDGVSDDTVVAAVVELVKEADIQTLTKGALKKKLETKFGAKVIKAKKEVINSTLEEEVKKKSAAAKAADDKAEEAAAKSD